MASKLVGRMLERFYSGRINGTEEFRDLVASHLKAGHLVLDLGCGLGRTETDFSSSRAMVVGCDCSVSVNQNRFVASRVRGDAYRLPFRDEAFDVLLMDFVMEHLEFPDRCAAEIFRVLKPDGYLFFRTPNLYHYVPLIASITPHPFHGFVLRRLAEPEESAEAFRTYYRVNTPKAVRQVFKRAGLIPREIRMVEKEPHYLTFALPAFLVGLCYERLVNRYERLAVLRSNIFGAFSKLTVSH